MKKTIIILWLGFLSLQAIAQKITPTSISIENGKIAIIFTVKDLGNKKIAAKLYTSIDNYKNPVKEVSGNIGTDISQGENTVYWDYKKEGVRLPDDIDFEIKATTLKLQYTSVFTHNKHFFMIPAEIGKKINNEIIWRSNNFKKEVIVELYLDGSKSMVLDIIKNTGKYQWQPASAIGTDKNYQIMIVSNDDKEDYIISNHFEIVKGKVNNDEFDYQHVFKVEPLLVRGEETIIDWSGALFADEYQISLYLKSEFDRLIGISKKSNLAWKIPSNIEKDKKYQIKIEDTKKASNYIISNLVDIDESRKFLKKKNEASIENEIEVNKTIERGSKLLIIFDEEIRSKYVIVELHQNGELVKKIDIVENIGHYKWEIPNKEDKGKKYRLKIVDKDNPGSFIYTTEFKIEK